MRKWGLVVSLFYAAAVVLLLVPLAVALVEDWNRTGELQSHIVDTYRYWGTWGVVAIFVIGQVLLLSLSVDLSQRRLRPRTHIVISAAMAGLFLAVLTSLAILDLGLAFRGDRIHDWALSLIRWTPFVAWAIWSVVFYRCSRSAEDALTRAISWLLRGSVLELLIAVPSHVIVRRRGDCCAPIGTGAGIATGIAIMLLSFGPGVLFLFKRRVDGLKSKAAAAAR